MDTNSTLDLQNQLKYLEKKYAFFQKINSLALGLMLLGGVLHFNGPFKLGASLFNIGFTVYLFGSLIGSMYARKIQKIRNRLTEINPSQFPRLPDRPGNIIANIILTLFVVAIIGIGGCAIIFSLGLNNL